MPSSHTSEPLLITLGSHLECKIASSISRSRPSHKPQRAFLAELESSGPSALALPVRPPRRSTHC
uniref:Uncharacterized protein n=1 Tax=Arundo donax TaxID=35708 RepID=A0A0A9EXD1_ARUDO